MFMLIIELLLPFAPYLSLAGFVVGLGAVTVIDLHGWLGRHSSYWTEATIRTHKVTKPLIWLGLLMVLVGSFLLYHSLYFPVLSFYFFLILSILILNGIYLSFRVSPFLLSREQTGLAKEPLPDDWQRAITVSFIISFLGWWTLFALIVYTVTVLY